MGLTSGTNEPVKFNQRVGALTSNFCVAQRTPLAIIDSNPGVASGCGLIDSTRPLPKSASREDMRLTPEKCDFNDDLPANSIRSLLRFKRQA